MMEKGKTIVKICAFLLISLTLMQFSYSKLGFWHIRETIKSFFLQNFIFLGIQLFVCFEIFLVVLIFTKYVDKSTLVNVGIFFRKRAISLFCIGAILAILVAVITWGSYITCNSVKYSTKINSLSIIYFIIINIPITFFQATAEELLFRTWVLKKLGDLITPIGAILASGIIFGGIHFLNSYYTFFAIMNAGLFGIVASISYFRTNSFWLAAGIHFGWNYFLGIVYNSSIFSVTSLTGQVINQYVGAEATEVGCIMVFIIGILVFIITSRKRFAYCR